MKQLTTLALCASLLSLSQPLLAGSANEAEQLASCKQEAQRLLGDANRLKLKSIAHRSSGSYYRLRVIPSEGESQIVTCLINKQGGLSLLDGNGLSLELPVYETEQVLTLIN